MRNASLADPMAFADMTIHPVPSRYTVTAVNITVPRTLRVSEANKFYPLADIVWRGEPYGNRYEQVEAIFHDAATQSTANMLTGPAVTVDIEVTRFHCLTEKTRYTVGGVHSLRFDMTVRDAATGRIIDGPRKIVADVRASGGAQAIADDDRGRTQRVVVVERLTQVLTQELTSPTTGGATPADLMPLALMPEPEPVEVPMMMPVLVPMLSPS